MRHRVTRALMDFDAVALDTDAGTLTAYYRKVVPLGRGSRAHLGTVIRELEPWESGPP